MSEISEWFRTTTRRGRVYGQIQTVKIYEDLSSEIINKLENNIPVNQIIYWIRQQTSEAHRAIYNSEIEGGALNKVAGDWNEYMATSALVDIAIDINNRLSQSIIAVFPLPKSHPIRTIGTSEVYSKFLNLFDFNEFQKGGELEPIATYKNRIFFSSPDYVIITVSNYELEIIQNLLIEQALYPSRQNAYHFFRNKLKAKEMKAIISLKTENRPDRRYQPLFEADMIKQIASTTNQKWKYFMVAGTLTEMDISLFSQIVTPDSIKNNYTLVDGTYTYLTKEDFKPLVELSIN